MEHSGLPVYETLPVDPISQVVVRSYTKTIFIFPLSDESVRVQAERQLKLSLLQVLARWPFLTGEVRSCADRYGRATHDGRVEVKWYPGTLTDDDVNEIFEAITLSNEDFPYTYDELAAQGMPASAFSREVFFNMPLTTLEDGRDCGKVMWAQASFFRGGLALSFATHHAAMDGSARARVSGMWAQLCHDLRQRNFEEDLFKDTTTLTLPYREHLDVKHKWAYLKSVYQKHSFHDLLKLCPEYFVPRKSKTANRRSEAPEATARLFVFSNGFVQKLKEDVNASCRTAKGLEGYMDGIVRSEIDGDTNDIKLSAYNCLSAFLWWHVLHARSPHLDSKASSSFFAIMNLRAKEFMPSDYFPGNAIVNAMATVKVEEVSSPSPFAILRLALAIRHAMDAVDQDYLAARVQLCRIASDVRTLTMLINDDEARRDTNFALNDWTRFGMDDPWSIIGTSTAQPQWYRKPWSTDVGYGVVLPRSQQGDADWEVYLGFEARDEELLLKALEKCCKRIIK